MLVAGASRAILHKPRTISKLLGAVRHVVVIAMAPLMPPRLSANSLVDSAHVLTTLRLERAANASQVIFNKPCAVLHVLISCHFFGLACANNR